MRRHRISNTRPIAVTEIDLLAYADGLLDGDPARRRAVEAFLDAHPAEAERIEAYIEQNRELHRLYDPVFHEPLPERLLQILERGALPPDRSWLRTAAAVAALLAAATAGWLLGQERTGAPIATITEESAAPTLPLRVTPEPAVAPQGAVGAGGLVR